MYMRYKDHLWPAAPHLYRDEMTRTAHYQTVDEVSEYVGISPVIRRITGEGVFFGENACQNYRDLMTLFEDPKAGYLEHPHWGSCYCYFTLLELTQEPKEGFIKYRFGFTGALSNGDIPK